MTNDNSNNNNSRPSAKSRTAAAAVVRHRHRVAPFDVELPRELMIEGGIRRAIVNPGDHTLLIQTKTGNALYMQLRGNPEKDSAEFLARASQKGWQQHIAAALADHLERMKVFSSVAVAASIAAAAAKKEEK